MIVTTVANTLAAFALSLGLMLGAPTTAAKAADPD